MAIFTPPIDDGYYFPSKGDLTQWVYQIWEYLKNNPIVGETTVEEIINNYLEAHPPASAVTSVNGQSGVVTLTARDIDSKNNISIQNELDELNALSDRMYSANNPPPYPVTSVNGETGEVSGLFSTSNPPPYPVTSVNGETGEVSGLYSASNPPPYPVTSVNGETGEVSGLYSTSNPPPYPVTSVNGQTGATWGIFYYGEILNGSTLPAIGNCIFHIRYVAEGNLPAGNTDTIEFNLSQSPSFFPISVTSETAYGMQYTIYRNTSSGKFCINITNHGLEAMPISNVYFIICYNDKPNTITWEA